MSEQTEIERFSMAIEAIVKEKKLSYIDAITDYCSKTGLEIETVPKLISHSIRLKIRKEAECLNLVAKSKFGRLI